MEIKDHRLEPGWYDESPNIGGVLDKPSLLVMHFTASGGDGPIGDADYFLKPAAAVSAHVVLGRDGVVKQVVPFNRKAWHAGTSVWRGQPKCNDFSIGIEIDNWGRLTQAGDGSFRSWTGEAIPAESAVRLTHKHEHDPSWWEIYNARQLLALVDLTRLILDRYPSITEIVGHDDIAPERKNDPGPAFPMQRFVSLATGRDNAVVTTRTVFATRLNARGGPGLDYDVLGQFLQGTKLDLLYETPGKWAQVAGKLDNGAQVIAWVSDSYLR